jgi:hypothetical protein
MSAFGGKADMRKRRLTSEQTVFGENNFPDYKRDAFFRQSFISTGAGAFFFGAAGAAVSSDGSLIVGTGAAVSSDGSLIVGTGAAVSSDGSLIVGTVAVVSSDGSSFGGTDAAVGFDGSSFDGTGAAVGFNESVFGATGTDVSSVGRGRGNGVGNRAGNEPCCLPSVPVRRENQVETLCAISDKGDRASVRAGEGACAFTDATPSVTRNRESATVFRIRTCTVSAPSAPNKLPG